MKTMTALGLSVGLLAVVAGGVLPALAQSDPIVQISQNPRSLGDRLENTEWRLNDLAGAGVLDVVQGGTDAARDPVTIRFEEGRIGGSGGCNRYGGAVEVSDNSFSVGAIASTRRACEPAVMDQENRYFQALQQAQRIAIEGEYLMIYSEGLEAPLRFVRLNPGFANGTLVLSEGRRNAFRVFTRDGQLLMNVYSKPDRITWLNGVPAVREQTPEGTQYTNQFGEVRVVVFVPNSAAAPTLTINGVVDR